MEMKMEMTMEMEKHTNVYVVCWNKTEINDQNITETDCGVCEVVYLNEDDARKKMWELSDAQMDELLAEWDEKQVTRYYKGDTKICDSISITSPTGIYEYWVSLCYHT